LQWHDLASSLSDSRSTNLQLALLFENMENIDITLGFRGKDATVVINTIDKVGPTIRAHSPHCRSLRTALVLHSTPKVLKEEPSHMLSICCDALLEPHAKSRMLSRAEYILYTTRYSTPYLREDLGCELIVGGGEREALIILVA